MSRRARDPFADFGIGAGQQGLLSTLSTEVVLGPEPNAVRAQSPGEMGVGDGLVGIVQVAAEYEAPGMPSGMPWSRGFGMGTAQVPTIDPCGTHHRFGKAAGERCGSFGPEAPPDPRPGLPDPGSFVWPPYESREDISREKGVLGWTQDDWYPWNQEKMDKIVEAGSNQPGTAPIGIGAWLAEKSPQALGLGPIAGGCVWEAFAAYQESSFALVDELIPNSGLLPAAATSVLRNPYPVAGQTLPITSYYISSDDLYGEDHPPAESPNVKPENVFDNLPSLIREKSSCWFPTDDTRGDIFARPWLATSRYQPFAEGYDLIRVVEDIPCTLVVRAKNGAVPEVADIWQRRVYVMLPELQINPVTCWAGLHNWWAVHLPTQSYGNVSVSPIFDQLWESTGYAKLRVQGCIPACYADRDFDTDLYGYKYWLSVAFNALWSLYEYSWVDGQMYFPLEEQLKGKWNGLTLHPVGAKDFDDIFTKSGEELTGGTFCKEVSKITLDQFEDFPHNLVKEVPHSIEPGKLCCGTYNTIELQVFLLQTCCPQDGYQASIVAMKPATMSLGIGINSDNSESAKICAWTYFWACKKAYQAIAKDEVCTDEEEEAVVKEWVAMRQKNAKIAWMPFHDLTFGCF